MQVVDALVRDQQLVSRRGESLAKRGRLRRNVVRSTGHHERRVLGRERRQTRQRRDRLVANQQQRQPHLQLLDVLGEVARRHALVDVLVPGERAELLDARLDVVPRDALARGDRVEVDRVDHSAVVVDHLLRDVEPERALRLEHREPQLTLEDDLVLGRPDAGHGLGGVARGEDVRGSAAWAAGVTQHSPRSGTPAEMPTLRLTPTRPQLDGRSPGAGGSRRPSSTR